MAAPDGPGRAARPAAGPLGPPLATSPARRAVSGVPTCQSGRGGGGRPGEPKAKGGEGGGGGARCCARAAVASARARGGVARGRLLRRRCCCRRRLSTGAWRRRCRRCCCRCRHRPEVRSLVSRSAASAALCHRPPRALSCLFPPAVSSRRELSLWARAWEGEALCSRAGVRVKAGLTVIVLWGEMRPPVTQCVPCACFVILFIVRRP